MPSFCKSNFLHSLLPLRPTTFDLSSPLVKWKTINEHIETCFLMIGPRSLDSRSDHDCGREPRTRFSEVEQCQLIGCVIFSYQFQYHSMSRRTTYIFQYFGPLACPVSLSQIYNSKGHFLSQVKHTHTT